MKCQILFCVINTINFSAYIQCLLQVGKVWICIYGETHNVDNQYYTIIRHNLIIMLLFVPDMLKAAIVELIKTY